MLENSLQDRSPSISRSVTNRSAITNGTRLFMEGDGRSPWARRWRDLVELHVADLGGIDNVSEAEKAIIRRAATLICELERREAEFAVGEGASDIALEVYQRASNSLRRLLESTGLKRRARDVTPTLADYLDEIVARRGQVEAAVQDGQADGDGGSGRDESEAEATEIPDESENASSGATS
jgi:hypothetical protein